MIKGNCAKQSQCFPACSTVANSDGVDLKLSNQFFDFALSFRTLRLRRVWVNGGIVQKGAAFVKANHFAAGTETRIQS